MNTQRVNSVAVSVTYWLLVASVFVSVAGMGVLFVAPQVAGRLGPWLPWFMKVPTWVYLAAVPAAIFLLYGRGASLSRRFMVVGLGSSIGLMAELIGTNTGYPFGSYSYTDFLAPKIFGDVPYLIPLSWYATSVLAFDFATRLGLSRVNRVMAGALFMVLWDLALDPAMVEAFPVWQWHVEGFFYGMPVLNLVGWFLTSALIMWAYERLVRDIALPEFSWTLKLWLVSAALPLGMAAVRSMWLAVVVGVIAVAVPPAILWVQMFTRRQEPRTERLVA